MSAYVNKINTCYNCPWAKEQDMGYRCSYYGRDIDTPGKEKRHHWCTVTDIITVESASLADEP